MSKKKIISNLLAAFTALSNCVMNYTQASEKSVVECMKPIEALNDRSQKNEETIFEKLVEINDNLICIMDVFLNFYNLLHTIKLSIDSWYKEIENSEGFAEVEKAVWDDHNIKSRGGNYGHQVDIVKTFLGGKKEDDKSTRFKAKLLGYKSKAVKWLQNNGDRIRNLNNKFRKIKYNEKDISNGVKEILDIQHSFISKLMENYQKAEIAAEKWQNFILETNFYEHKICFYMFRYREEGIEYYIEYKPMVGYIESTITRLADLYKKINKLNIK